MSKKIIIGVMGGGTATRKDEAHAYDLGKRIAEQGWVLLNGGRNAGIMDASAKGARDAGGLTIGILPNDQPIGISDAIDIPIYTGMGNARNVVNVLTSHVIVACPGGTGTISEIALALKSGKPVVLLNMKTKGLFEHFRQTGRLFSADRPEKVINIIKDIIDKNQGLRIPGFEDSRIS
jgi:uncharacterized protein (TIGR00725 family)